MTFDDKLRDITSDIGRGTQQTCRHCGKAWPIMLLFSVDGRCPTCQAYGVPVASDAMAERDEHGEVKGVLF